ncbi:MAG: hypothetical protein JNM14_05425 [Ferruginibacter sp.]|nr:hypothetical protein [Ferruginibacter sp.]
MNKNISILVFLGLMLAAAIISVRSYNQLQKQKKTNQDLVAQLEEKENINKKLKQESDSVTKQLTKLLISTDNSGQQTDPKWNTQKTTLIKELKNINEKYTKVNNQSAYQKAYVLEKEGFEALEKNDFQLALQKISLAEQTSSGFHMCFEISELLKKKQKDFKDPATQKEIKQEIIEKYSWKGPAESLKILKMQVKDAPVKPVTPVVTTTKWPVKKIIKPVN